MKQNRYFVDQRVGCIAVRDSEKIDDSNCLSRDTAGVICYWGGINGANGWEVPSGFCEAAKLTCDTLNLLSVKKF